MALVNYDVYIEQESPSNANDKLVIVQFPSLRSQFNNDASRLQLSIKPKCVKMKLDVDLNSHSRNYSSRKAELLAEKSKPQLFPGKKVNKHTYTSTRNLIDDPQLFVCKVVGDRLVCRHVSDIVTMRSDLSHFDLKEEADSREEIRPVSVRFAATDRQNAPVKPKETQSELDDLLEEYVNLKFQECDSSVARLQREYLFGLSTSDVKIKPDPDTPMATSAIVDVKVEVSSQHGDIKPKIERMDVEDIYSLGTKTQPGSPRKSTLIRNRVKECLMKAKLVSFEEIYRYLQDYRDFSAHRINGRDMLINVRDIIDALSEHAVMVRGNWAIKSEILYGDSTTRDSTDVTGVSINLFIAARDYLILLFDQNELVSRQDYTKRVKLPDYDALELFKQLGSFRPDLRKWDLKLPKDELFIQKFPEVVQRQATFWKVRRANKLSLFFKN